MLPVCPALNLSLASYPLFGILFLLRGLIPQAFFTECSVKFIP